MKHSSHCKQTTRALGVGTKTMSFVCALAACGGAPTRAGVRDVAPATVSPGERKTELFRDEPQWQDALGPNPALVVLLRPKELRADRVYGPLLRMALAVARGHSRVVEGTRVLEAMQDADEVIVSFETVEGPDALTPDSPNSPTQDLIAVVRGVRGDLDPGTLVDPDGHALWAPGPTGRVRELVHERDNDGAANPASLFELPGRTWVIASGEARNRARDAFARPLNHPEPTLDSDALAVIRVDGPALVSHIRPLRATGPLAAVGTGMRRVDIALPPGLVREVRAVIAYSSSATATAAGEALVALKDALTRKKPPGLEWLASAVIERASADERAVHVTTPLPAGLVDEWMRAGHPRPQSVTEPPPKSHEAGDSPANVDGDKAAQDARPTGVFPPDGGGALDGP